MGDLRQVRMSIRWLIWSSIVFVSFSRREFCGRANCEIGQSWQAQWAFELVGCVFLLWMMIMAYQVYQDDA